MKENIALIQKRAIILPDMTCYTEGTYLEFTTKQTICHEVDYTGVKTIFIEKLLTSINFYKSVALKQ